MITIESFRENKVYYFNSHNSIKRSYFFLSSSPNCISTEAKSMIKKLKSFSKFEFLYHTLYFVKIILKLHVRSQGPVNKIFSNFKHVLRDIANFPANNAILSKLLFRTFDSPLSQQVIKKGQWANVMNSSIMLDLLLGDTESEKRQFRLIGAHNVDSSRKH